MSSEAKPRICQVLGVEVGEVFSVRMESGECRWFVVQGVRLHHVRADGGTGNRANNMSLWLIEHPDLIIRQPRFSDDEVATMRALYGAGYAVLARDQNGCLCAFACKPIWAEKEWIVSPEDDGARWDTLPRELFPSILHGDSILIREVIQCQN